jgi:hypothetical protein
MMKSAMALTMTDRHSLTTIKFWEWRHGDTLVMRKTYSQMDPIFVGIALGKHEHALTTCNFIEVDRDQEQRQAPF